MARVRLSRRCRRVPRYKSERPARRRSRRDGGEGEAAPGPDGGTATVRGRTRGTTSVKTFTSSPFAVCPWHLAKRCARRGQKTSNTSLGWRRSNLRTVTNRGDKKTAASNANPSTNDTQHHKAKTQSEKVNLPRDREWLAVDKPVPPPLLYEVSQGCQGRIGGVASPEDGVGATPPPPRLHRLNVPH
jgi:hypothetical protein